ncbi:MAG: hypothetical protein BGO01_07125 [Armatimonadetes bacterium 55-13]|nr:UbiA prenyltransferase family protein [Armatimonadota bacterium]ODU53644.1 MAG: hypothetical protein ABT09_01465 [bacterium SCN 57-13]OJU62272.1 MAG: hypothetical protein BGO01_07125 [Armatimonadetes bacterium 55-13]
MIAHILLLRPKQWTKNLLVFAALLFVGAFRDVAMVQLSVLAFIAMCLASSTVYVFNDLRDIERDRKHPRKCKRPLAAGLVKPSVAVVIGIVCLVSSLLLAWYVGRAALGIIAIYLVIQGLYNNWLKNVAVADVFCIGLGFVLRAVLGAAALRVEISGWLLFCTGALALMLGFSKRRNEFITMGDGGETRESLSDYTRPALDALVSIFACGAAICYGIYSLESPTARKYPGLILTSLFVFYGIARYVLIVFSKNEGGEPETLLYKDPHILMSVILFILTSILALSGFRIPLVTG